MSTTLTIFAGTANQDLASRTVQNLGIHLGECRIESFPDGELQVELKESVRGHDVYLLQSTSPPADKHLLELALLADACRRAGAGRVTALVPYFGYARQDRCTSPGQALGARVLTDLLQACPVERLVTIDLHTAAIEGFFSIAVEHLSAVPLLAEAARPFVEGPSIVVAPDLGAVKLAKQYAQYLELPLAIVHKIRQSGEAVNVQQVVGDVRDRLSLVGYFEGIDAERGIAWRAADSFGLRRFPGIGFDEQTPDHSTISRTRRLIDVETHRKVFFWILELLRDKGLVKGKTVGIDATTLEANAAMRSIVRRDNGESYEEFLTGQPRNQESPRRREKIWRG